MNELDWIVLGSTLAFIVGYGTWRTRKQRDLDSYLRGGREANGLTVGLSVMATQASAITFLSTPGQAFESGMGFIQFYFGLPIALILVSVVVVPLFYKLNVYTAYEYLEERFDLNTRLLTAFLFLIQRGLAAGITIYAPSIVLSSVLGWDLDSLNVVIGLLVIIYTVSGGTKAVNITQKWQMTVIMGGMFFAFFTLLDLLSPHLSFMEAVDLAGAFDKMNIVDFDFDLQSRYTIWSGLTGGLFLSLSYFGTDQSQVQRYISAKSIRESRMGLMFNAILKIPMQFFILLTGVMLFVFYQVHEKPINFNRQVIEQVMNSNSAEQGEKLMARYSDFNNLMIQGIEGGATKEELNLIHQDQLVIKESFNALSNQVAPDEPTKDSDYVFIRFILDFLPNGAIGLLLAVILSAAMSSTSGELNALASTTINDYFKRLGWMGNTETEQVRWSKWITVGWGLLAIGFALVAQLVDNLIELVNILGSLFYGTILGIFVCAIYLKSIKAKHVFAAAIVAELLVLFLFATLDIGFLLFNVIGCLATLLFAMIYVLLDSGKKELTSN
ncbi:MAG: sodium:solute symporter [Flavobacteriales bacterium]